MKMTLRLWARGFIGAGLVSLVASCGMENGSTLRETKPAETYETIKPIFDAHCIKCHNANSKHPLDTEARLVAHKAKALESLKKGTMPPKKPEFATSTDGLRLITWFQGLAI